MHLPETHRPKLHTCIPGHYAAPPTHRGMLYKARRSFVRLSNPPSVLLHTQWPLLSEGSTCSRTLLAKPTLISMITKNCAADLRLLSQEKDLYVHCSSAPSLDRSSPLVGNIPFARRVYHPQGTVSNLYVAFVDMELMVATHCSSHWASPTNSAPC